MQGKSKSLFFYNDIGQRNLHHKKKDAERETTLVSPERENILVAREVPCCKALEGGEKEVPDRRTKSSFTRNATSGEGMVTEGEKGWSQKKKWIPPNMRRTAP